MTTVSDLLEFKGHEVVTIGPEATVYDALALMDERNVGALMVLDGGKPLGIISERDYARKVILQGRASKSTPVREIMSGAQVCVKPETPVDECMAIMTQRHIRHLPVFEGGYLVGLVSIGDVVRAIIDEKDFTIHQLEKYICS
jgi:CBS domain-containing protein